MVSQERQTGDVQPGPLDDAPGVWFAVGPRWVLGLPGVSAGVDRHGITWLERNAPLRQDLIQLPAMDRLVLIDKWDATMARHIQENAARDDALAPVLDGPKG